MVLASPTLEMCSKRKRKTPKLTGNIEVITGRRMKKILFISLGLLLVIGGIALTFKDWIFIQMVFRGVIGPLLAVVGLVVLTIFK